MRRFLLITLILASLCITLAPLNWAMESQQYQLQSEDVTTENLDQSTGSSYLLNEADRKLFNENGFVVYPDTKDPFFVSIDSSNLSFGSLKPNKTVIVKNIIHIISKKTSQVQVSELRALSSLTGGIIPNTACDSGCSYLHAKPWTKDSSHGFGYTVKGRDIVEDFKNSSYFRALADLSKKQEPAIILKNTAVDPSYSLELTFKLNPATGNTQSYSTIINLDALPGY